MSETKLTGKPLPHEAKRILKKTAVSPTLPTEPMAQGERAIIKPNQDAAEIVTIDGERRRTANLMNENYTPVITAITDLPHGVHYGDGERRLIYNAGAGSLQLAIFQRTGDEPDAGQWWDFGTSVTILVW